MKQPSKKVCAFGIALGFLGTITFVRAAEDILQPGVQLHVDSRSDIALTVKSLEGADREQAMRIAVYPIATWMTKGTPAEVRQQVAALVAESTAVDRVPVLVVYNLPFRDCQQYSAGGAQDSIAYQAWIDAIAAGIGDQRMVVILEPDGLGIIPHYRNLRGDVEWCRPSKADAEKAAAQRFALLNYAVDAFVRLPRVAVYLDGTHSGWLEVGDIAHRLVAAGVLRANGFFLNVSNFEPTPRLEKYGTWISKCIYFGTTMNSAEAKRFRECASQFAPARIDDFTSWTVTDEWYARHVDPHLQSPHSLRRFVIDTSRNGRGQWSPPRRFSDPQRWCNPPDRGLGERPTTDVAGLLDAKLWIKVPGESDGQCTRGESGPVDPARGMVDPPAGKWFKKQAAELIRFASPPLASPSAPVSN